MGRKNTTNPKKVHSILCVFLQPTSLAEFANTVAPTCCCQPTGSNDPINVLLFYYRSQWDIVVDGGKYKRTFFQILFCLARKVENCRKA
jgi:hypothetical protein